MGKGFSEEGVIHIWLEGPLRVILFFRLLLSPSPVYWLGDGVKWLEGRRGKLSFLFLKISREIIIIIATL